MEPQLRRSDPWSGGKSGRERYFPCMGEKGEDCLKEGVTYSLWCLECGWKVTRYFGESGRNAYSREREHLDSLEARDKSKSVLWLHSIHHHNRRDNVGMP